MRYYKQSTPTPLRHCEQSEAIQLLNQSAYKWIATAHYIRLAMTNYPLLRAKRSNLATKPNLITSGLLWLIAFASQRQVTRSFHSFAKTANRSFILHDQSAHTVLPNCHYYQTECPLASGRREYSLY